MSTEAEEYFRFGERISEEMERIGLKQKQFATRICVSDRTLRSWLSDSTAPDLRDLRMMEGAGCDTWYIITGERLHQSIEQPTAPYTAAERAAAVIAMFKLSEDDAELLKVFAKRLAQ